MPHHHHQHTHDHSSEHDHVEANAEHFDEESKNQEKIKHAAKLAQLSAPYILRHYKFDKKTTEVLDFGAGWGQVSKEIIPYAKSILGVDVSQGMVDLYNEIGQKEGFEGMRGVRAVIKGEDGELDGRKFDVIICTMVYHHFEDAGKMTKILAGFLKSGGKLIVSDFRPDGGEVRKSYPAVVVHHGMDEDAMRDAFTGAGLMNVIIEDAFKYPFREMVLDVFFVVATKA